jgi:hypothetical protein
VAPGGILHYVEAHNYLPPEEFRRAVLECPPMTSRAYLAALLRTDWAPIARRELMEPDEPSGSTLEATLEREHRWYVESWATPPEDLIAAGSARWGRLQHPATFAILLLLLAGAAILIAYLLVE